MPAYLCVGHTSIINNNTASIADIAGPAYKMRGDLFRKSLLWMSSQRPLIHFPSKTSKIQTLKQRLYCIYTQTENVYFRIPTCVDSPPRRRSRCPSQGKEGDHLRCRDGTSSNLPNASLMYDSYISRNDIDDCYLQAAGGIISASLLAVPGASGYYKGGLTVRSHSTTSNPSMTVLPCLLLFNVSRGGIK
jgi:hypothetical protein